MSQPNEMEFGIFCSECCSTAWLSNLHLGALMIQLRGLSHRTLCCSPAEHAEPSSLCWMLLGGRTVSSEGLVPLHDWCFVEAAIPQLPRRSLLKGSPVNFLSTSSSSKCSILAFTQPGANPTRVGGASHLTESGVRGWISAFNTLFFISIYIIIMCAWLNLT